MRATPERPEEPRMRTSTVEIRTPEGTMPAHLAEPEGRGPFPAVVVLMEAFGLVPHIRNVADRLAGEGYVALAPDMFYRELPDNKASYDDVPRGMKLMGALVGRGEKFLEDVTAALDFLEARPEVHRGRIGVTGFCMGGALTFATACLIPERIAAAAPFYGGGIVNLLPRADRISCPLYLFFGEKDAFIPLDQVQRIEARLAELEKTFHCKVYPGADHGFFCEERASYHAEAAADAWRELTRFFARHLKRS
jgi:carboxymethylenebutenolidase